MCPVRSASACISACGLCRSMMTTRKAGPSLSNTTLVPVLTACFQVLSAMMPKAEPSGRSPITQGWLW